MSDSPKPDCPFCQHPPERVIEQNTLAVAFAVPLPVSRGHTLIIGRRHVPDFFELSAAEVAAIIESLNRMGQRLLAERATSAFNIGVNDGSPAGQTATHAHVHLIPRYLGDTLDRTGGVRNVIPGKGDYRLAKRLESQSEQPNADSGLPVQD